MVRIILDNVSRGVVRNVIVYLLVIMKVIVLLGLILRMK